MSSDRESSKERKRSRSRSGSHRSQSDSRSSSSNSSKNSKDSHSKMSSNSGHSGKSSRRSHSGKSSGRNSSSNSSSRRSSSSSSGSSNRTNSHSSSKGDQPQQHEEEKYPRNNGHNDRKEIPKADPQPDKSAPKKQNTSNDKAKDAKHPKEAKSKVEKVENAKVSTQPQMKRAATNNAVAHNEMPSAIKSTVSEEVDTQIVIKPKKVEKPEKEVPLEKDKQPKGKDNKKDDRKKNRSKSRKHNKRDKDRRRNRSKDRKKERERSRDREVKDRHCDREQRKEEDKKVAAGKDEDKRDRRDKDNDKKDRRDRKISHSKKRSQRSAPRIRIPSPQKRGKKSDYSRFSTSKTSSNASSNSCESLRELTEDSTGYRDSKSPKTNKRISKKINGKNGSEEEEEKIGQGGRKQDSGRQKPNKNDKRAATAKNNKIKTVITTNYKECLKKFLKYSILPSDEYDIQPDEVDSIFELDEYLRLDITPCLLVIINDPKRIPFKRLEVDISMIKPEEVMSQIKFHPKLIETISNNFKAGNTQVGYGKLPIELVANTDETVIIRFFEIPGLNLVPEIKKFCSTVEVEKLLKMNLQKEQAKIIKGAKSIPGCKVLEEELTKLFYPFKFEIDKRIILDPKELKDLVKRTEQGDDQNKNCIYVKTPIYLSEDVSEILQNHFGNLQIATIDFELKNPEKFTANIYELVEMEIYPKLLRRDPKRNKARFIAIGADNDTLTKMGESVCKDLNKIIKKSEIITVYFEDKKELKEELKEKIKQLNSHNETLCIVPEDPVE